MRIRVEKQVPKPALGDYRISSHFAFWPSKTSKGEVIWLETFKRIWRFEETWIITGYPVYGYRFPVKKWMLKEVKRQTK